MLNVIKRRGDLGADDVYIARQFGGLVGSALGNPFKLGRDGTREECVNKYRRWLWEKIQSRDEAVMSELMKLADREHAGVQTNLVCYCAPLACHGDVVKAAVHWLIDQGY